MTDTDLYERGVRTAAACWEALAHSTSSADVHRLPHVSVAVFADEPEQSIYNNAILGHGLAPAERSAALEAMEALYAAADISSFAAWVHETDRGMRDELTRRGYAVDTTTRAMGMSLDDSHCRGPRSSSHQPHGASTCASSASRRLSCGDLDLQPCISSSPNAGVRASQPLSDSTMRETAASTTSGRSRIRVAVASAPR